MYTIINNTASNIQGLTQGAKNHLSQPKFNLFNLWSDLNSPVDEQDILRIRHATSKNGAVKP